MGPCMSAAVTDIDVDTQVESRPAAPGPVALSIPGLKVFMHAGTHFYVRPGTPDEGILHQVVLQDIYNVRTWAPTRVDPVIVDVGAHIGLFARLAAWVHPTAQVLAFEPHPQHSGFLMGNLAKLPNARACLGALVNLPPGRAMLQLPALQRHDPGAWTLAAGLVPHQGVGAVCEEVPVAQVYRLPEFMQQERLARVDFLKLSCVGSEYAVLDSLTDAQLGRVDHIVGRWHLWGPAWLPHYHRMRLRLGALFELEGMPADADAAAQSGLFVARRRA